MTPQQPFGWSIHDNGIQRLPRPLLKNSFGVSIGFTPKIAPINFKDRLIGSSLERKPPSEFFKSHQKDAIELLLDKPLKFDESDDDEYQERSLSPRSKSKIRKKVIAFSRLYKKLSFVTLTFLNKVTDREAIKALGAFLDYADKLFEDFQNIWVAERQTKNKIFQDNIHFHLITNQYWEIDFWLNYWIEAQKRQGIIPRDENFKPSSAFDVKAINSTKIKEVGNYLTKYVTKNSGKFRCLIWNCSRKISRLYTDFYSDMTLLSDVKELQDSGLLGDKITTFHQEHCDVYLIPLNEITDTLYDRIDERNKIVWQMNRPSKQRSAIQ